MRCALLVLATAHQTGLARRETAQLAVVETGGSLAFAGGNPWCFLQSSVAFGDEGEPLVQIATQVTNCRQCHTKELTHSQTGADGTFKGYHVSTYLTAEADGGKCNCFLGHEQRILTYITPVGSQCGIIPCWRKYIAETDALTLGLGHGRQSQMSTQDLRTGAHSHAEAWRASCSDSAAAPDWFHGVEAGQVLSAPMVLLRPVQDAQRATQLEKRAALVGDQIEVKYGKFDFTLPAPDEVSPQGHAVSAACFLNGVEQPTDAHCEAHQLARPVLCCAAEEAALTPYAPSEPPYASYGAVAKRTYTRSQTLTVTCRVVTDYRLGEVRTFFDGRGQEDVCA